MINQNFQISEFKKEGFTLAEVLITLVIVGVVAAMTIPSLVNRTNKEELRTGLLKAQSVLSGVLERYYIENGIRISPSSLEGMGLELKLKKAIMPYFSVAKDCGKDTCFNSSYNPYKTFNNETNLGYGNIDDGQFVLDDGMIVLLENNYSSMFISVDVNGEKNPNRAGYDLFCFQINSDGNLLPMGAEGTALYSATDEYCSKTSDDNKNGLGCTAKALKDSNYFKNLP